MLQWVSWGPVQWQSTVWVRMFPWLDVRPGHSGSQWCWMWCRLWLQLSLHLHNCTRDLWRMPGWLFKIMPYVNDLFSVIFCIKSYWLWRIIQFIKLNYFCWNLLGWHTFCLSDWTTGPHCEHCRPGSFGSALAGGSGCVPCECNGHGDPLRGYCHNQTGQCYCTHNTQGAHCESCLPGYYGDPR